MGLRQHLLCVRGSQREDGHRVRRAAGGHHALRGQLAQRGLQAHQVVETSRNPVRPGRVGAPGKAGVAQRNRHRRARTEAAGYTARIERIAACPMRRPRAAQPAGKLVQVGLADGNGPGVQQALHHGGTGAGGVGLSGATGHRHTLVAGCQCPATGRFFSGPCSQRCS